MKIRVGQGVDIHRLVEGRPLMLGGVSIPYEKGLLGHSDGDALLHAITDAILGATGRGDIGCYFPDSDPEWKDADSKDLLSRIWEEIQHEGWRIENIDSTVLLEQPRLKEFIPKMKEVIAGILECKIDQCGVKATTSEKMGFVGTGEGVLVHAVALLSNAG